MKVRSTSGARRGIGGWLGIVLAAALPACREPHKPPPAFNVFGVTDKFFDVDALGDKEFVALGYGNKILRTEDGGATWTLVGRLSTRASLTRLTFHGQKGWGVGHAGSLVATEDGGRTWRTLESPTEVSLFDVDFPSETRGYAVGDGSTVVWTEDGGRTWKSQQVEMSQIGVREDMSLAIENPIFYSVDFVDEETGWVTGEFGQIRFTRDGGKTWEAQHGTLLGAKYRDIMALPTLACVRMLDRTRGIAVGTYGAIATTVDGGQTWQFRDSPVADPLYDIRILPDGTSLIVGSSGIILRGTIDEGWSLAATPPGVFTWISSIDLAPSGNGVAVGGHGLVLTSADFGKNWLVTPYQ